MNPLNPLFQLKYLVFAILIVLAGYLGLQIGKSQTKLSLTQPSPQSNSKSYLLLETSIPTNNSPIPTVDPTANWKTYTEDRELKFTLKYPENWKIDKKDGMYGEKNASFLDNQTSGSGSLSLQWNSQPVEPLCKSSGESIEIVQINGKSINMCHAIGSPQEPEGYFYNGTASGINYSIVTANSTEAYKNTIFQILSTLKFTENPTASQNFKKMAYIKTISAPGELGGNYNMQVDYINFVNDSSQPNGYRIDNPSNQLTTLYFSSKPTVVMQTFSHQNDGNFFFNQPIDFDVFYSAFKQDPVVKGHPYWIEVKNDQVTKITERYVP